VRIFGVLQCSFVFDMDKISLRKSIDLGMFALCDVYSERVNMVIIYVSLMLRYLANAVSVFVFVVLILWQHSCSPCVVGDNRTAPLCTNRVIHVPINGSNVIIIIRPRRMRHMRTIAIDDPGVCQSVCHTIRLCKNG